MLFLCHFFYIHVLICYFPTLIYLSISLPNLLTLQQILISGSTIAFFLLLGTEESENLSYCKLITASHSFTDASRRYDSLVSQRQKTLLLTTQRAAWASCLPQLPLSPSPTRDVEKLKWTLHTPQWGTWV